MADAVRDQNHVPSILAVLNTDTVQGQHLVTVKINPANNSIKVNTTATISFTMVPIDSGDQNYVGCGMWVGTDGLTYPFVATSDGELLISTT